MSKMDEKEEDDAGYDDDLGDYLKGFAEEDLHTRFSRPRQQQAPAKNCPLCHRRIHSRQVICERPACLAKATRMVHERLMRREQPFVRIKPLPTDIICHGETVNGNGR